MSVVVLVPCVPRAGELGVLLATQELGCKKSSSKIHRNGETP